MPSRVATLVVTAGRGIDQDTYTRLRSELEDTMLAADATALHRATLPSHLDRTSRTNRRR
jgi:hypothetical protein